MFFFFLGNIGFVYNTLLFNNSFLKRERIPLVESFSVLFRQVCWRFRFFGVCRPIQCPALPMSDEAMNLPEFL